MGTLAQMGAPRTEAEALAAKVNTPSPDIEEMAKDWEPIDDLLGGTRRMREKEPAARWLPRYEKETPDDYAKRLNGAVLYPGVRRAVSRVASKPFCKPITIKAEEKLSESNQQVAKDVDGQGTTLTQFGRATMHSAARYGMTHVLVDHPSTETGFRTLRDERENRILPIWTLVPPPAVIGGRYEVTPGGTPTLAQIRIGETRTENAGAFGSVVVNLIRVWEPASWTLWRQPPGKDDYEQIEEGAHSFGEIPLVTIYFEKTGFMQARPPFLDVAYYNIAHWQSSSRQRQYLDFARIGNVFASGISDAEGKRGLVLGPSSLNYSENPDAKMMVVEHAGTSLKAGSDDLVKLEADMADASLEPWIQRTGGPTATGRFIDEEKVQTDVQAWVRSEEDGLRKCFAFSDRWRGLELSEDVQVDVFSEWSLSMRARDDLAALHAARSSGFISDQTYLHEVKRRGLLSDEVDLMEEMERVQAEARAMMVVAGMPEREEREPGEAGDDDDEGER